MGNRKCPWCGADSKMVGYHVRDIYSPNVNWKNDLVFVPACEPECAVKDIYVSIDAKDENEAWEIYNKEIVNG